jgi:hypothetical protein
MRSDLSQMDSFDEEPRVIATCISMQYAQDRNDRVASMATFLGAIGDPPRRNPLGHGRRG